MATLKSLKASFLLILSLMTLLSCGGGSGGGPGPASNKIEVEESQGKIFRAHLSSLNEAAAGATTGTVTVTINGDEIFVRGAMAGAPSGIKHYQFITTGSACPGAALDTNADTFVDHAEGSQNFGQSLIPLDSDLDNQIDGSDWGPIANPAGGIVYVRSGSFSLMLSDLQTEDPTSKDHLAKLLPGERLNLENRAVVIYGVSQGLPETVATMGEFSREESLPIACGILNRVESELDEMELPEE